MNMIFICYILFLRYIMRNGGIDIEVGYLSFCNKFCCFFKDEVGVIVIGKL